MGRNPEDYARLLASAICKLHAAETGAASAFISEDILRVIRDTFATAMDEARKVHIQQELIARCERQERTHLHS